MTFLTNRGKNEDEDEQIWKNEFEYWIPHIRLCSNFHENLRKKNFDPFFKTFLNSIFELSISKLGCMELLIKI